MVQRSPQKSGILRSRLRNIPHLVMIYVNHPLRNAPENPSSDSAGRRATPHQPSYEGSCMATNSSHFSWSPYHRRRKVLNIGGTTVQNIWAGKRRGGGGVGGGKGGCKLFAGCKLIGAPAPNHCQIIAFLTLKQCTYIKLVHL